MRRENDVWTKLYPASPGGGSGLVPVGLPRGGSRSNLYVSSDDHPGVIRAAGDLQADIDRVTGGGRGLEALEPSE